jgi:hypothetical protein
LIVVTLVSAVLRGFDVVSGWLSVGVFAALVVVGWFAGRLVAGWHSKPESGREA